METDIHNKDFALRLVLKERLRKLLVEFKPFFNKRHEESLLPKLNFTFVLVYTMEVTKC